MQGAQGPGDGSTGTPAQKKWVGSHVWQMPPGSTSHCVPKGPGAKEASHFGAGQTKLVAKISGPQLYCLNEGSDAAEKPGATLFPDGNSVPEGSQCLQKPPQ